MAGWQRGGFLAERVLWIAVGVVLVVAAHLLPALCRPYGWRIRFIGAVLWIGCMAATCYGHAVFFLLAQQHAGEIRAAAVPAVVTTGRDAAVIASDRASVVARLARVTERRCAGDCPALRIERTTLAARLEALDTELNAARRQQAAADRAADERDAARRDPVTGASRDADLLAGLAFAAVLEAVACFCWLLALRPDESPEANTGAAVTPVTVTSHAPPEALPEPVTSPVIEPAPPADAVVIEAPDEVAQVIEAIAAGKLRATVNDIRKHLGCSQARAAAVRKQVAEMRPT
ncbi:hypothetical protein [Caballeronia sp. AZ7_KS35]|uniref:hypothetical protein n=1 Tax=Caballeronia sp. AZ7_KS35 TaxID=2921762 RepID=UPI002028A12A|nr:hypothetical protein [Caballeronia sp. AZ7_KS35]